MAQHQQQPPPTGVSSLSETAASPAAEMKFAHQETLRQLASNSNYEQQKLNRSIEKPLPLILPHLMSPEAIVMRQQRLTDLERLHERQLHEQQEEYSRRQQQQQQHFLESQARGADRIGGAPIHTIDTSEDEELKVLPEIVWAVRGAQVVFAIILMAFLSYVVHWWTQYWHANSPAEFSFLLYLSIHSMFSVIYIVSTAAPSVFGLSPKLRDYTHPYALVLLDLFLQLSYLIAFISLGVFLKRRVCFGTVCNIGRASVGFGAFQWLLFLFTTIYSSMQAYRHHKAGRLSPRTIRQIQVDTVDEEKRNWPLP